MIKRLTKHGNSLALIIDKPILELLKIDADTPLEITTDGNALVIAPVQDEQRRKLIQAAIVKGNQKYGNMLQRLAD